MKKKIFIRADGSSQIGLGHLVRCTALAYMLKDDFQISFICKIIPDDIIAELKNLYIRVHLIENDDDLLSFLDNDSIVILDGYNFDKEIQKTIKDSGAKLVCIDDLNNYEFSADLIISQTPGVKASEYKAQSYTKFALGLEYALLRPAFLENITRKHSIETIDTLFICFGGSDYLNLTLSSLNTVLKHEKFKKIIVVTGSAYVMINELKEIVDSAKRIEHYHNIDAKKMFALMLDSNLAIAPSSSVLLELISVGVPAITGYYAENQKRGSEILSAMNLAISCGDMNKDYLKKLDAVLKDFTLETGIQMVKNQKAIKWAGKNFYLNKFKTL